MLKRFISANRAILFNASSLISTTLIASLLGFGYWWLAARMFPVVSIGEASAAISALQLLSSMSMVGLGTLLISELPRRPEESPTLISTALCVTGAVALGLSVLFVTLIPFLISDLRPALTGIIGVTLFVAGSMIAASSMVLDQATIGLLRGDLQLARNTLFAVAKVVLLLPTALWLASSQGIFATWVMGGLLSLIYLILRVRRLINATSGRRSYRPDWSLPARLGRHAMSHHALNLTLQAPRLVLPLMVTALLSTTVNAHFYVALMMANLVFMGPIALTTALHAVGSADQERLMRRLRSTFALSLLIGLAANIVVQPGAEFILGIFGPAYIAGAGGLRLLCLTVFPMIIRYHFVSLARIQGRTGHAALLLLVGGGFELLFAAIGAVVGGLTGLCLGWFIAVCIQVIPISPIVYRAAVAPPPPLLHRS